MDIRDFIEQRLDEAERHARKDLGALDAATAGGDWHVRYGINLPASEVWAGGAEIGRLTATLGSLADGGEDLHRRDGFLVARMVRTARGRAEHALRDVEAKRRILAAHPLANDPGELPHCETCRYIPDPADPEPFLEAGYPCPTVRALALPFVEHPDCRQEWVL